MSILQRSASPQAPAGSPAPSDRLRVITAGRVGNMEARLGTSGFDVVAAAETEDALIDAVSVDEPDAIVVEADLCDSLEHVRDLAPDAVLIVVGDHTPAGALGRVERGMSGTAMAGLLHALVAEGVGAAVVWGLVPTFRAGGALHVPHGVGVSLLSAKADLIRAHLANALRDHAELVTTASTILVTVSASLVVAMSAPSMHERPERMRVAAPTVEHAAPDLVVAVSPATGTPVHAPSAKEGEPGDRRGANRGESRDHGRHVGEDADDQGENGYDQGANENANDQGENADDQGANENDNDQGENSDDQGANENANDQGENSDDQGGNENASNDKGANENANDQGAGGSDDDQGDGGNSQD
jgi:hypothetical protein